MMRNIKTKRLKALKNDADRLYSCIILDNGRYDNKWETVLLYFTVHIANVNYKIQ